MNARAKLAFFGDDDDDLNLQQKILDDDKVKSYAQGVLKKSKREKEKEAEIAKRQQAERETAKAYEDFLQEFEGGKTTVASSTSGGTGLGFVKASGGGSYVPSLKPKEAIPTGPASMRERPPSPPPAPSSQSKPRGKRAMDSFLEELKRDQAERESRLKRHTQSTGTSVSALAAFESQVGSRDRGDPLTTNVFVANLPMGVTEDSMGNFFAKMGPVGSIKIMWPRGDPIGGPGTDITQRRGKAAGMSGFVSFMTRKAAEDCVREMDGFSWGGCVLRVGWSKAVPIAARAKYDLLRDGPPTRRSRSLSPDRPHKRTRYSRSRSRSPRSKSRSRSRDRGYRRRSYSRSRSRSRSRTRHAHRDRGRSRSHSRRRSASNSRSRSRSRSRTRHQKRHQSPNPHRTKHRSRSRSRVAELRRWPAMDPEDKAFIETVAKRVKNNGKDFERVLRQKERHNTKFSFMFDSNMPEYHLFKKFVSSDYRGPYGDISFKDEGDMEVYSTDTAEESEKERVRKGTLGRMAERRFETMLRSLTGRRGELARCMAFALDHSDAVVQLVDIIVSSLIVEDTAVPRKVARLFLICDILHNSATTISNAWKFRQEFQTRLPVVFDHLSTIYHSFPGRITAETFKKQILSVVEVWEDWIVFPPDFTTELRRRLDGNAQNSQSAKESQNSSNTPNTASEPETTATPVKFKTGGFKPAAFAPAADPVEDDTEDMELDDVDGEDVDGMEVDIDGGDLDGGEL